MWLAPGMYVHLNCEDGRGGGMGEVEGWERWRDGG